MIRTNRCRLPKSFACAFAVILVASAFTACKKDPGDQAKSEEIRQRRQEDFQKGRDAYAEHDYQTAVRYFAMAANNGLDEAQYFLGLCFAEGKGMEKNLTEAAKWFRKAAEQGHIRAMYRLALCCLTGGGAEENKTEAFQWFSRAAERGDAMSMYRLGMCYHEGQGVEQDRAEAVKWFRRAVDTGGSASIKAGKGIDSESSFDREAAELAEKMLRELGED